MKLPTSWMLIGMSGGSGLFTIRVAGSTTSPATNVTVNGNAATLYADKNFEYSPGVAHSITPGINTFTPYFPNKLHTTKLLTYNKAA
jgi:hypothetical protein